MSAMRPISAEDYEVYYGEMYVKDAENKVISRYAVPLDADPQTNPKGINEKLARIQGNKDRLIVILIAAMQNKAYWEAFSKKLAAYYESEVQKAMATEAVKTSGNAGIQKAMAHNKACEMVLAGLFKGEGTYEGRSTAVSNKYMEAQAFLNEVKAIYDNLDSASMNLAVQLKACMMNERIFGVGGLENDSRKSAPY